MTDLYYRNCYFVDFYIKMKNSEYFMPLDFCVNVTWLQNIPYPFSFLTG